MKKLLMILICGFAFTQSIQTKQVAVDITYPDPYDFYAFFEPVINISDYVELSEGYYYKVELIYIENLQGDSNWTTPNSSHFF